MIRTVVALSLLGCVACGRAKEPKLVSMRMVGSPPGATVTIDDIFVGRLDTVATRGVAIPVGAHRVSVEAPGFLPWDKVVEAKEGAGPLRLNVQLTPIPE